MREDVLKRLRIVSGVHAAAACPVRLVWISFTIVILSINQSSE